MEVFIGIHGRESVGFERVDSKLVGRKISKKKNGAVDRQYFIYRGKMLNHSPDFPGLRDRANWILTCSKITELDLGRCSTCAKVDGASFLTRFLSVCPCPLFCNTCTALYVSIRTLPEARTRLPSLSSSPNTAAVIVVGGAENRCQKRWDTLAGSSFETLIKRERNCPLAPISSFYRLRSHLQP